MKILIILLLSLCVFNLSCKSQELSKTINSKYEITKSKNSDLILFRNIKDTINSKKSKYDGDARIEFNMHHEIDSIISKVLIKKIPNIVFKNKIIVIGFFIDKEGTIKSFDFRINNSIFNIISISDIETIEKELKKTLHPKIITFRNDADYTYYTYILKFNNLR